MAQENRATLLDWSQVQSSIEAVRTSHKLPKNREAFGYFALSTILKIDDDEVRAAITDGGDDRGIDAVYIDSRPERRSIHLFQFKHIQNFEKREASFPSNEIDKVLSFLNDVLSKDRSIKETCNPLLWQKVEAIWEALDESVHTIYVHFASNASKLKASHRDRLNENLRPYKFAHLKEHDLLWFSNRLARVGVEDRDYSIPLVEEQYYSRTDGFAQALIGTVRADEIVKFISDPSFPSEVDDTLFEENIRVYLGEDNDLNRKILASAISSENNKFWYLNNGITIVCESLTYQPKSSSPKAEVRNPQIVNGGQTSHALFEAARNDEAKVAGVRILVRIIETKDNGLAQEIAEATNSQTPIRSRDIRSTDAVQIRLENALKAKGYFYERKNDQHVDQPSEKRIDASKLGQIILAYVMKEPDRAKTASNRVFGELYALVFDEEILSAENVLSMWNIYRHVENDRQIAIRNMTSTVAKTYEESWIVEGIFHILYLLSVKCEQSGTDIFDTDSALEHYGVVKEDIDDFIKQNPNRAAYRIFRSSITKRLLVQYSNAKQYDLPFA